MNPKKPTAQKILQGTFRKHREVNQEPEPAAVETLRKPPRYLNKYAKTFWNEVQSELIDTGVLTCVDWAAFEICCVSYGQFREAYEAIYNPINPETGKREKRTLAEYLTGKNSQTMPEYAAMNKGREEFLKYSNTLGLNPVARSRVNIQKSDDKETDPMLEILNDGGRG